MSFLKPAFLLGIAIGTVLAVRSIRARAAPERRRDGARPIETDYDQTLEDSFPASDPPAPRHIT